MRWVGFVACFAMIVAASTRAAEPSAVVHKDNVDVYAQPKFDAPKLATLSRNTSVQISSQQGLWYELIMPAGTPGYVRVDGVRVASGAVEDSGATLKLLMGGKPGEGRITETAGVRGIDESELKSASLDQAQLDAMIAARADAATAATYAGEHGWTATTVAYPGETKPVTTSGESTASSQGAAQIGVAAIGAVRNQLGSLFGGAAKLAPKSELELSAEELALGPEIAGRILGARPLWTHPEAQQRVNTVGRWVASQSSRPELPWTFGVIDTAEVNAFAAPGGYVLVSRGMYELLTSDAELAAVLGHEINHCVERDHYNVIRKQEMASAAKDTAMQDLPGTDSVAAGLAKRYADEYGATIVLTSLDRDAEFRADEAAQVYVARAGMNPLAFYSVLQKMAALGSESPALVGLYKTHPSLDARMDRIDKRGYGQMSTYLTRE